MPNIHTRPLNLLPNHPRPVWPLQAALAVVVMATAAMSWSLWGPGGRSGITASIGSDFGASPSPMDTPASSSDAAPAALHPIPVSGAAPGLESDTVRFSEERTGKVFQLRLRDGSVRALTETAFKNLEGSWWVPGHAQVIGKFDDGSTVSYRRYDFSTGVSTDVGSLITALALSPDGTRVAYAQTGAGKIDIIRSDTDGTNTSLALSTRALDVMLSWPSNDTLIVALRRSLDGSRDLLEVHSDGTIVPLLTRMQNLETSWSRDGAWLLYSYYLDGSGVSLRLRSMSDGSDVDTGLLTSAAKCAWATDSTAFVCGVPSSAALTKDVPAELTATNDSIVLTSRDSREQTILYRSMERPLLSVSRPFISSSGAFFVFSNLFDKKLYSFPLR